MSTKVQADAPATRELTSFGHMANGIVSSAAMLGFVFPVMTVAAKMMAEKSSTAVAEAKPRSLMGMVKGTYNGYWTSVCGAGPTTVVAFIADSYGRQFFGDSNRITVAIGAGALAGVVNSPFDRIKTIQQIDESKPSARLAWKTLAIREGFMRAVFKGMPLVMMREAWFNGAVLAGAEACLPLYGFVPNKNAQTVLAVTTAAAIAGVASTPIELLRVRVQQTGCSVLSATKNVWKKSGPKGFFAGVKQRCFTFVVAVPVLVGAKTFAPTLFPDAFFK